MTKTISAWEARRNFGKLMDEVATGHQTVVIESHGEAKIAIVPLRVAEAIERERQQFFDTMRAVSARVNLSEDEAMEIANAEVAAHRAAEVSKPAR